MHQHTSTSQRGTASHEAIISSAIRQERHELKRTLSVLSISTPPLACSRDNARTSRKRMLCTRCPMDCPSIGNPGDKTSNDGGKVGQGMSGTRGRVTFRAFELVDNSRTLDMGGICRGKRIHDSHDFHLFHGVEYRRPHTQRYRHALESDRNAAFR